MREAVMEASGYRALVVDDEKILRQSAILAMEREGFRCDEAADGESAMAMLDQNVYDCIITDLRMPYKHGHQLAVELLERPNCPVIVVVTGIIEPKLAKDLILRGVQDIVFKPANYGLMAAKVRAFVVRRREDQEAESAQVQVNAS